MPPPPPPAQRSAETLPPLKAVAFWGVMLALPVLFFVLLESGLRLAAYGTEYPLFEQVERHPEFKAQSREVARRYFYHAGSVPTPLHDVFQTVKPANEVRLFVQGGSSAAGFPFYHGAAFSRMLKGRLQDTFPDRPIEVVNTAMAAVNTFTLLDLAEEIIREQPDAVLIYAGHNEYYGAFGVGSTESVGKSRALVNAYLRLRHFRTVQLVRDGLGRIAAAGARRGEPTGGSLMARMVAEQSIPLGSPDYERGLRQFRGNLSDLLRAYRQVGIPVFVATLVSNERDHEPFTSAYQTGTNVDAYQSRLRQGVEALREGRPTASMTIFQELTRTDTLAAVGFYHLGRALEAAGDTSSALRAYQAARDRDALRFRAPSAFNRIIREVAAEHGATVVDVEARFREAARGGILGGEHMLEHLHPNVDGYFLLADAFYGALLGADLFGGDAGEPVPSAIARSRVRLTPADSLVGVLRLRQLLASWPFAPADAPFVRVEDELDADTPEARIAIQLFREGRNWLEAIEELASDLERAGRVREATRTREAMIRSYPMLPQPHLGLAGLYTRQRELDLATQHYRAAIARGERTGNAHGLLGAIVLDQGMQAAGRNDAQGARDAFESARALLEQARQLNPRNPQTLYNLSGAYAQLGQLAEARETAEAVIQLQPSHTGARTLLASLPRGPR